MGEVLSLPFAGAIVSPLIGLSIYVTAKRRFHKSDTLSSRAIYFYRMMSGVLGGLFLGQLISHTYLTSASELRFFFMFIFVGYFVVMNWSEMIGSVWNYNPNYVAPAADNIDVNNAAFNQDTGEQENIVVLEDLQSTKTAQQLWASQDTAKQLTKRLWMLGATFAIFSVMCATDGMLIVVRLQANVVAHATLIVCYYANCIALSVVLFSAMVHARLQAEATRLRLWTLLGGLWCVMLVASSVPALVGAPVLFLIDVLNNRWYIALNGVATGGLLKLHFYFHHMEMPRVGWGPSICGALVCTVAALQSMLTGVFL